MQHRMKTHQLTVGQMESLLKSGSDCMALTY